MIRVFLKESIPSAGFAVLLFAAIYFLYYFCPLSSELEHLDAEKSYIRKVDTDNFAAVISSDIANARRRFFELIDLKNYDGSDTVDLDELSQLAGEHPEYTLQQIEWIHSHEKAPDTLTGSVNADNEVFIRIERIYAPVVGFGETVKQKISVNRLLLKKERASEYDRIIAAYELLQLENIQPLPERITALSGANSVLKLFCSDMIFPFLTAFLCFDMFTKLRSGGHTEYIKTLECGGAVSCKGRFISAMIVFSVIYALYLFAAFAALLICCDGTDFLGYPCQLLGMAKECVFSFNTGHFLALTAALRFLYHAVFFMLFSLVSLMCKNAAVSAVM